MIHLHLHSHFSVLDGLGKIEEIINKAKAIGAPAVALTDHASVSGLPDFIKKANEAGIKPIVGCEFYWVDDAVLGEEKPKGEKRNHLTVWAKTWTGVKSIMEKLTIANQNFYYRPRLSWADCLDFKDCMIGTACSSGVLIRDDYKQKVLELLKAYGPQDVYLEIMPHKLIDGVIDQFQTTNERAIDLHQKFGLNLVATNDVHYVNREDAYTQEILLAVQTGATWDDPKRWRFEQDTLYMRTEDEMINAFYELPYEVRPALVARGISGAKEIAEKANIESPKFGINLPSPYTDTSDDASFQEFSLLLKTGWLNKIAGKVEDIKAYGERLTYEISVIKNRGFVKYFLIVEDIIRWARSNGIMVGPARGSAAGSLVCYVLGITQIDPLRFGLYFERFLNPDRIDLPDIDCDFQDDRRDEVVNYIRSKYGWDCTGHINTFGQLSIKSAFRDVARVFGINNLEVNVLSKQIEDDDSFEKVAELAAFAKKHPNIVEQAKKLSGTIRQQGTHACGLVISSERLGETCVIEKRKEDDVINWDMKHCEGFGLIKIDVLGLATLTVLSKAKKLIKEKRGVDIEFTAIPLNDEKTLEAFSRGEGTGIFQFENQGMQSLLRALKASDFETITATTALFRPGSLNSGQTDLYTKIYRGDEYESYPCPQLKPILGPTKSVMVYQEQIMQIFNQCAGFTWAESDKMRKIIGKKLGKDEFEKHRAHFNEGCAKNGIDSSVATTLFDKMVEFASYSFNLSHAVSYTTISFWAMYLKVHYPAEFLTAQLSHGKEDRVPLLVRECERLGIAIKHPDINSSDKHYEIDEDGHIVPPLGVVKGVGDKAVEAILEARKAGVFLSKEDFVSRVNRRVVNKKVVETLYKAGLFQSLGLREPDEELRQKNYAELLPIYRVMPTFSRKGHKLEKELLNDYFTAEVLPCAAKNKRSIIAPKAMGASPSIMVINNPVGMETEHFQNDGSKHFLLTLKGLGLTKSMVYYTSPMKCVFKKVANAPKECQSGCLVHLRKEIEYVKPKLIVCFASSVLPLFGCAENMGKMNGKIEYNREFDTYVLYCYSPQYAYFSDDKQADYLEAISQLREIFSI